MPSYSFKPDRLIQSQCHNLVTIIVPGSGFVSVTCARVRSVLSSLLCSLLCSSSTSLAVQSLKLQLLISEESVFILFIEYFKNYIILFPSSFHSFYLLCISYVSSFISRAKEEVFRCSGTYHNRHTFSYYCRVYSAYNVGYV